MFLLAAKIRDPEILGENVQIRHSLKMKQSKIWPDFENLQFKKVIIIIFSRCGTKGRHWSYIEKKYHGMLFDFM